MYDVIVIGAGISGLSCSKCLSEKGFKVLVLEKTNRVGKKIGENLQGLFERDLEFIDFKIPKNNPVKKFYIWLPEGRTLKFKFEKPFMFLIIRGESEDSLDNYLAREAESTGAEILTNTRAVDISFEDKYSVVRVANGGIYKSKYIVAADGANGSTRRILGLDMFETKGIGIGAKMVNVNIEKSTFHSVFGQSIAPGGYGYINSYTEKGVATAAVSYRPKYACEKPMIYFKRFLQQIKPIIGQAKTVSKFCGKVVCGKGDQTLVFKNLLFIGEAGGFQDRMFGFGMRFAFMSAKIASEIIEESYTEYDFPILSKYENISKQTLIKDINKRSGFSNILRKIRDKDIVVALQSFEGEEELLQRIFDTDDWMLAKWKLLKAIIKRPSLLRFSIDVMRSLIP